MNMERERGRPFFACIFTRRKQREIISILPAGDFEKWCSSLSLSLSKDACFLRTKFFSLSRLFAVFPSIHLPIHPSLPSPLIQRRSPRDKVTRSPILPILCTLSPVKFPLLKRTFLPSSSPFKRRPSVRSCVDPVSELSTFPRLFSPPRSENWRSFESRLDSRETLEAEDAPFEFENFASPFRLGVTYKFIFKYSRGTRGFCRRKILFSTFTYRDLDIIPSRPKR